MPCWPSSLSPVSKTTTSTPAFSTHSAATATPASPTFASAPHNCTARPEMPPTQSPLGCPPFESPYSSKNTSILKHRRKIAALLGVACYRGLTPTHSSSGGHTALLLCFHRSGEPSFFGAFPWARQKTTAQSPKRPAAAHRGS